MHVLGCKRHIVLATLARIRLSRARHVLIVFTKKKKNKWGKQRKGRDSDCMSVWKCWRDRRERCESTRRVSTHGGGGLDSSMLCLTALRKMSKESSGRGGKKKKKKIVEVETAKSGKRVQVQTLLRKIPQRCPTEETRAKSTHKAKSQTTHTPF